MSATSSRSPDTGSRPRVLIADDDPSVRAMLTIWLETEFELVAAAADALEAIQLAADTLPDVALIDVQMPHGGGTAAVRGIVDVSPATAMVALSADESQDVFIRMLEAGATSYRRKGEPSELLIETLHRAIASHRSMAPAPSVEA